MLRSKIQKKWNYYKHVYLKEKKSIYTTRVPIYCWCAAGHDRKSMDYLDIIINLSNCNSQDINKFLKRMRKTHVQPGWKSKT